MDFDELVVALRELEGRRVVLALPHAVAGSRRTRGVLRYVFSNDEEAIFAVERPGTLRHTPTGTTAHGRPFGFLRDAFRHAESTTRAGTTVVEVDSGGSRIRVSTDDAR